MGTRSTMEKIKRLENFSRMERGLDKLIQRTKDMTQEEKRESLTTHKGIPGGQWWNPFNNYAFDYINLTGRRCPDFYMDFLRCSERTGLQNSASRCKEQFEDLKECLTHVKRKERLTFIKAERLRQGRAFIDPLPLYAEQSGENTINTEKMKDDIY